MLAIADALDIVVKATGPLNHIEVDLFKSLGMTLANDINSTIDSPPFDKSIVDGYAIRSSDLISGTAKLAVVEVVTAGQIPTRTVEPGHATQIMTGAPIPDGADAVVKVEETERAAETVLINSTPHKPGTNIVQRGKSIQKGDSVLKAGVVLNGSRIGALAELGLTKVPVTRRPTVAILATGDELVPIAETPGPGQIRNSNEVMLATQIESAGATPVPLGIARDNRQDLAAKIQRGLDCDLLVLSGGVSAGTLDLVPSVLTEMGVVQVFHKVAIKPGKPVWFGKRTESGSPPCLVFGLPGNPVSSLVCCELFVRTAIRRLMSVEPAIPQAIPARLEHEYSTKADRPTYHPARLTWTPEGLAVTLVTWHGSSDLCGTAAANGMAFLDGEARQLKVGDRLDTIAW